MDRIFVGNIPYTASEQDVRDLVESYGFTVKETAIIMDRQTLRSRGFGFVQLNDPAQTEQAIQLMSSAELFGRKLTINRATPPMAMRRTA
jgi:RNA recognition motif-containing protein